MFFLTCMLMAILKLSPSVICSISNSLNSTSSICVSSMSYISWAIGTTLMAFFTAILSSGESNKQPSQRVSVLYSCKSIYIIYPFIRLAIELSIYLFMSDNILLWPLYPPPTEYLIFFSQPLSKWEINTKTIITIIQLHSFKIKISTEKLAFATIDFILLLLSWTMMSCHIHH